MRQIIAGMSIATLLGVTLTGAGCSSSSSTLPLATSDSGTGHKDSGTSADTGSVSHDSGHAVDSHVATPDVGVAHDAPSLKDAVSDGSGDAGSECTPPSTFSYTAPAFVPAVVDHVCTPTQIAAFIAACGYDNGTATACAAWQTANVTDGGASCGNCIDAPKNAGGVWMDPAGDGTLYDSGLPNYGGCLDVSDSTHGAACGAAFNNANACINTACETTACNNAGDPNAFGNCQMSASTGACMSFGTAQNTACATDFADGGVGNNCFPSNNSGDLDDDFTYILTLICGSPADAGTRDAATDAKKDTGTGT